MMPQEPVTRKLQYLSEFGSRTSEEEMRILLILEILLEILIEILLLLAEKSIITGKTESEKKSDLRNLFCMNALLPFLKIFNSNFMLSSKHRLKLLMVFAFLMIMKTEFSTDIIKPMLT